MSPRKSIQKKAARPNAAFSALDVARRIEVLLVEDNPDDIELTLIAFRRSKVDNLPNVVQDGQACMDYLHRKGKYANAVLPDLIFLDLNLPFKNGREVLAEIKADPALRHIPVVILTTSQATEDVVRSYNLQAAAYVTKPVDFPQFLKVVKAVDSFWLRVVTFPPRVRNATLRGPPGAGGSLEKPGGTLK